MYQNPTHPYTGKILWCDLETFSETPIRHGAHRYAEKAEVILWAYALNDGPIKVWDRLGGQTMPGDLYTAMTDPSFMTVWHNGAAFDNVVLKHAHPDLYLPTERIHDTLVQALCHGLPGALGKLCEIFGLPEELSKDKEGRKHINLFCKPRPKNSPIYRATPETHPQEWAAFVKYAGRDIAAMREIFYKMPMWNYRGEERELWHLDQEMNNRGVYVDQALARAAIAAVEQEQKRLSAQTVELTEGELASTRQRDALLKHILQEYGVELPDLQSATLEKRLHDDALPPIVKELISIRLEASTSSTTKYKALLNMVSSDGRLRGITQFCGAARTRRWAGRNFQVQNLPSKGLPPSEEVFTYIDALKTGCLDLVTDSTMKATSAAIRGCLVASPGKLLAVADLSNIEGRDAAWLADEDWKLEAFAQYDLGTGADLYRLAYAKSFSISVDEVDGGKEKGPQRQIGKVQELALQYEGGVGAFVTFALVYGIDLDQMAADAYPTLPRWAWEETDRAWVWAQEMGNTFGLSERTWRVCDTLKRLWRAAHPGITDMWSALRDGFINATQNPGQKFWCGNRVFFYRKGAWLRMVLPSGGSLCYASPEVTYKKGRPVLSYMGMSQYSRQWSRIYTHGGKLFGNACQATARDVMAANMPAIRDAGYDLLFSVHDELITEVDERSGLDHNGLAELLATTPEWAPGLPLAAAGFTGLRYKKDS